MNSPLLLIILDGWGLAAKGPGNAISRLNKSFIQKCWNNYPHTELKAAGSSVGLPEAEAGNTETGHLNLGAGRVVPQDLLRINQAIKDESFYRNPAFTNAFEHVEQHKSNLHLMGIVSDAQVHGSVEHLFALLETFKRLHYLRPIYLHLFTDGRDSSPEAASYFIHNVKQRCLKMGTGEIVTLIGRYYAMDRDLRWERTEKAYAALVLGAGESTNDFQKSIESSYRQKISDEFLEPLILGPRISDSDAVIFFNYRIDRTRQLTKLLTERQPNLFFVSMTEYEKNLASSVAFPLITLKNTLGEVISKHGLRQLRATETEKERFVTYYFNGYREKPFPKEDRLIIPSPHVATYDLQPEMSAEKLTQQLISSLKAKKYQFAVINFANPDMVGHTGNIPAAIRACAVVDSCVQKLVEYILGAKGTCIVTADHGNVEEMVNNQGKMDTEHSSYLVPFILISHNKSGFSYLKPGKLGDVAPTILHLLKIKNPKEMTGNILLTS